jgi:hypothetical protein
VRLQLAVAGQVAPIAAEDGGGGHLMPLDMQAHARALATGNVAPHYSAEALNRGAGLNRGAACAALDCPQHVSDAGECLACAALDVKRSWEERTRGGLGGGSCGERPSVTPMPNSVRAPHILDLLRRVAREPDDASLPLTAATAGQQQRSSSSSSSSGTLLLLAVDKPYTLQELLDKAVIFFEHSMRAHHRRAVGGAAGDALSNTQGGFGVESETCRLLLTLDLDFDLHIGVSICTFVLVKVSVLVLLE